MEMNSVIRAFVNSCNDVNSNDESMDSEEILRNLDMLIGHCSSWEHNGKGPHWSKQWRDCISRVVSLLLDAKPTPQVSAKALSFLQTLAHDPRLLDGLCGDYQLCSALAVFLQSSTVAQDRHLLKQVIQLMKSLCYRRESFFTESSLSYLLKILFKHIEDSTSDLSLPCLELLNYATWSSQIAKVVARLPNFAHVCKVLLRKMGVENTSAVIHALSTLANLPLEASLSAKIFGNGTNVRQVLHLVLSIVTSENSEDRNVAVDLFQDLLSSEEKRGQLLRQCKILVPCVQKMLERPVRPNSPVHETLTRFLAVLSSDKELFLELLFPTSGSSSVHRAMVKTATAAISTEENAPSNSAKWATIFFASFFEVICDRGELTTNRDLAASVIKVATTRAFGSGSEPFPRFGTEGHLSWLKMLEVLWESGDCGKELLKENLPSGDLQAILEPYLEMDPLEDAGARETDSGMLKAVLGMCSLLVDLVDDVSLLRDVFRTPSMAGFLSLGLCSTDEKLMRQAFRLLCTGAQSRHLEGEKFLKYLGVLNSGRRGLKGWESSEKESQVPSQEQLREPPAKHGRRPSVESSIEEIVHRLENGIDVGELKNSEVLAVYEGRILALKSKEEKLQQLLASQSALLQESDRLVNRHLCSQAHWEAEMDKMQAVVRQYERRLEDARDDHAKLTKELQHKEEQLKDCKRCIRNLEAQVKQMEEANDTLQEKANRLVVVQKNLETAEKENAALSEMIAMLQRHGEALKQKQEALTKDVENLEGEKKALHKTLKEKEAKVKEQAKCMHLLQTKLDEKTTQAKALVSEKNVLQEANCALQKEKHRLEQEVSSLEASCRKTEACLQEKTSRVEKLTADLEKFRQMQAMIRNISANTIL